MCVPTAIGGQGSEPHVSLPHSFEAPHRAMRHEHLAPSLAVRSRQEHGLEKRVASPKLVQAAKSSLCFRLVLA